MLGTILEHLELCMALSVQQQQQQQQQLWQPARHFPRETLRGEGNKKNKKNKKYEVAIEALQRVLQQRSLVSINEADVCWRMLTYADVC
jgi:hypothetical protein